MAAVHPNRNSGYFSLSGSVGETLREAPMKFRRSRWKPGTVYGIPLADGSFGIGQSIDAMWESGIYIAVFSYHFDRLPVAPPPLGSGRYSVTWRRSETGSKQWVMGNNRDSGANRREARFSK